MKIGQSCIIAGLFTLFIMVATSATAERVKYTIVDEKIYDIPIKTQIEQHIVVSGIPTKEELEIALQKFYSTAIARRGFRYHDRATNVYIYIYGTRQQAEAGQALWVGMLAIPSIDKDNPRITVNEDRLAALVQVPEEHFGLSEQSRKQVFLAFGLAADRSMRNAMERIPDSQYMEQIELERELLDQYRAKISKKYGLTSKQLNEISLEGIEKGWVSR